MVSTRRTRSLETGAVKKYQGDVSATRRKSPISAKKTRGISKQQTPAKETVDVKSRYTRKNASAEKERELPTHSRRSGHLIHAKHNISPERKVNIQHKLRDRDSSPVLRRSLRHKISVLPTMDEDILQFGNTENIYALVEKKNRSRRVTNRAELRDLLAAQGKDLSDLQAYMEPDIYSSVKSRKRLSTRDKMINQFYISSTSQRKEVQEESQSDSDDGHTNEEQEGSGDESDEEEENGEDEEDDGHPYMLRKVREAPQRYTIVQEVRPRRPRSLFETLPCSPIRRRREKIDGSSNINSPYQKRRRRARAQGTNSSSSTDSSSGDEMKFRKRQDRSIVRARTRCMPININPSDLGAHSFSRERKKIGQSLADIDPMSFDSSVTFASVGGHSKHIRALKEMIVFPLLYPEVFEKLNITPPRGCLFYGPPGTGKTLMARALANECSTGGKSVAFFMKKGADCLSKWIGESERQLRLLFDQAYQMRPSIIFFDEIDGLAPIRSSRQDQIHSSIVSTLLALMDGLDNRGEVVVIGATNRIDSIDPALRRPGRFDREFSFPLPDAKAREEIVRINTCKWSPKLNPSYIKHLAAKTVGYCGADIKALCTESGLFALRRRYPQIYKTREKLQLDVSSIKICSNDFLRSMKSIIPTAQRSASDAGRALSSTMKPVIIKSLKMAITQLSKVYPLVQGKTKILCSTPDPATENSHPREDDGLASDSDSEVGTVTTNISMYVDDTEQSATINAAIERRNGFIQPNIVELIEAISSAEHTLDVVHRPRFIVCGEASSGHISHLAPAILHDLEGIPVHRLDLPSLYGVSVRTPEESCAQVFREARRTTPSIVYLPNAIQWWNVASPTVQATLDFLLQDLPPNLPILFFATANGSYEDIPQPLAKYFHRDFDEIFQMPSVVSEKERREFFAPIFLIHAIRIPPSKKHEYREEDLPVAPAPPPAALSSEELRKLEQEEESSLRNLRLFLRDVLMRLSRDRRFKIFTKPVDFEEVPDYFDVIKNPMDFSTMLTKIDQHKFQVVSQFLDDIDLICDNALEYNPDRCAEGNVLMVTQKEFSISTTVTIKTDKLIRHRACAMRDMAHAIIDQDLDPKFEQTCMEIVESREKRGYNSTKHAPKFYPVLPKIRPDSTAATDIAQKNDVQLEQTPTQNGKSFEGVTSLRTSASTAKKNPGSSMKPKRKRSSWSRGLIGARKRRKRLVQTSRAEMKDDPEDFSSEANASEDPCDEDEHEDDRPENDEAKVLTQEIAEDSFQEERNQSEEGATVMSSPTLVIQDSENHSSDTEEQNGTDKAETPENCETAADQGNKLSDNVNDRLENKKPTEVSEPKEACMETNLCMDQVCAEGTDVVKQESEGANPDTEVVTSSAEDAKVLVTKSLHDEKLAQVNSVEQDDENVNDAVVENHLPDENGCQDDMGDNEPTGDKEIETTLLVDAVPHKMMLRSHNTSTDLEAMENEETEVIPLVVDHNKLLILLEEVVKVTESFAVEELERIHSSLSKCVRKHRMSYDKTLLTQELGREIQLLQHSIGRIQTNQMDSSTP